MCSLRGTFHDWGDFFIFLLSSLCIYLTFLPSFPLSILNTLLSFTFQSFLAFSFLLVVSFFLLPFLLSASRSLSHPSHTPSFKFDRKHCLLSLYLYIPLLNLYGDTLLQLILALTDRKPILHLIYFYFSSQFLLWTMDLSYSLLWILFSYFHFHFHSHSHFHFHFHCNSRSCFHSHPCFC